MAVADYTDLQAAILRKTILAEAQVQDTAGTDLAVYEEQLIERAETSTQAALLISQIVLGKVPVNGAKLDSLAAFAQDQFDYYSSLGVARPELGPYEALGRGFASTPEFAALSNGKEDGQFVTDVYVLAFGNGPTSPQVQHFINQIEYFTTVYTNAGIPAASAALQARGAVLGQIVGEAATQEGSTLDNQAEAWLRAAADGTAVFDAPIGDSDPVPVDTTQVLKTDIDVIVPTADVPLDGNDTLLGNGQTIQSGDTVDLGDGFDKANLVIEPTSLFQLLSVYKLNLTNIEQVNVTAGNSISAVIPIQISADNWTGVQEFWMRDSNLFGTAGVVVDDIQSNMALGFDDYQGTATYLYDNGGLGANATVDVILQDASTVFALNTQTQAAGDDIGRLNLTVLGAGNLIGLNLNTNGGAGGNDGLSQLHLFGDGNITLIGEGELNSLTVLNGSAHSGDWTIDLTSSAALAAIGGIGDNFLDFNGGFTAADGFDGGDGDDTLEVDVNSGQFATSANVQQVEHFRVTGDLSADRIFTNSAGFQDIALVDGATTQGPFPFFLPDNNLRLIDFDSIIIEGTEQGYLQVENTGSTLINFAENGDFIGGFGTATLDVAAAGDVTINYSGAGEAEIDVLVMERNDGFTTWETSSMAFTGTGDIQVDITIGDVGLVDLSAMSGQVEFSAFATFGASTDYLVGNLDGVSLIHLSNQGGDGVRQDVVFTAANLTGDFRIDDFDATGAVRDNLDLLALGVSSVSELSVAFVGGDSIITSNTGAFTGRIILEGIDVSPVGALSTIVDLDGAIG